MDVPTLLDQFTRQMRREVVIPDMEREVLPRVTRFIRPAPGMSFVLYSNLAAANAEAEIETQIAYFTARRLPFSWKVYGNDQPHDLLERLTARGFTPDPPDALMLLDLAEVPPSLVPDPAVDIRRIDAERISDVVQVMEQVWGGNFSWMYARLGAHLAIPGYLSLYAACVDGQPACAGWTYFHPGSEFASLWGGSTVPAQRGKGLYTAILAARASEARQRGIKYLTVDAGEMSRPIVERHGFIRLTDIHSCDYTGPKPDA